MFGRSAARLLREALEDTPVVLVHGPRQAGKSTLARTVADEVGGFKAINLDDPAPRGLALEDPAAFIEMQGGPVLIDEVQRAPGIFLPIKSFVDRHRKPGQFLLTGSSNVLALPKLADSLAGRMAIVDLLPLSQAEITSSGGPGESKNFVDLAFDRTANFRPGSDGADLHERIARGGFPEPMARSSASRRDAWFKDYVRTLLERDVRDLANIEGLAQMPRVLRLISARSGEALNVIGLSRDTGIPNTSLHRYLDLLKAVFLIHPVAAWSSDQGVRLTKTPKTYLVDTGLLCHVSNITVATMKEDVDVERRVLENFVAMELRKLALTSEELPELFHLRTVRHLEVDFVLEARGGDVVGIDVKGAPTVRPEDAEGLKFLKELAGDRFRRGIVLYQGKETVPLARDIVAVPISALWA